MSDELSILDNAPVVKAETKSPELKPTASGNYVYMKIQRNEEVLKDLFENVIHADGFVCNGMGYNEFMSVPEVLLGHPISYPGPCD